jgi:glutathione peroxidase
MLLMSDVASMVPLCPPGFTEQYVQWNAIKASINDSNFDLLAIPTNQFGLQEPGSDAEIPLTLKYVRPGNNFEADFAFAAKTNCNGAQEERLYSFLKVRGRG